MRPIVEGILRELVTRHRGTGRVDLNDIAEVIDARSVTYDEVEHIILRLEAQGLRVAEPLSREDIGVMRIVISSAYRLRAKLRRKPTIDEISIECGHAPHTVRRALEHGRSAARVR